MKKKFLFLVSFLFCLFIKEPPVVAGLQDELLQAILGESVDQVRNLLTPNVDPNMRKLLTPNVDPNKGSDSLFILEACRSKEEQKSRIELIVAQSLSIRRLILSNTGVSGSLLQSLNRKIRKIKAENPEEPIFPRLKEVDLSSNALDLEALPHLEKFLNEILPSEKRDSEGKLFLVVTENPFLNEKKVAPPSSSDDDESPEQPSFFVWYEKNRHLLEDHLIFLSKSELKRGSGMTNLSKPQTIIENHERYYQWLENSALDMLPLFGAIQKLNHEILQLLFEARVDLTAVDSNGDTPLAFAIQQKEKGKEKEYETVVNALIGYLSKQQLLETQINLKDRSRRTPLLWAARVGSANTVALLLKNGADPDIKDSNGETPLMWAAKLGFKNVVQALVESKARINASSTRDCTALMWAVKKEQLDIVQCLLQENADPAVRDTSGKAALDYAQKHNNQEIIKAITRHIK